MSEVGGGEVEMRDVLRCVLRVKWCVLRVKWCVLQVALYSAAKEVALLRQFQTQVPRMYVAQHTFVLLHNLSDLVTLPNSIISQLYDS